MAIFIFFHKNIELFEKTFYIIITKTKARSTNMEKTEKSIYETIKRFDNGYGVPDYHNLADKMLPLFVHSFLIVYPDAYSMDENVMYYNFNDFLSAVEHIFRYGKSYDTIAKIIRKDTNVFKKAVEYILQNSSKTEIILYLD